MGLDECGIRGDGADLRGARAARLAVAAPRRLFGEHGLGHGGDLVFSVPCLDRQDDCAEIWWP